MMNLLGKLPQKKKERKKNLFYIFWRGKHTPRTPLKNRGKTIFIFLIRNKHQFYTHNIIKSFGYKFITITHNKK